MISTIQSEDGHVCNLFSDGINDINRMKNTPNKQRFNLGIIEWVSLDQIHVIQINLKITFIKQVIQVHTNLTQTHLFSTQISEKRVEFILCWEIISNFATLRLPHMILQ